MDVSLRAEISSILEQRGYSQIAEKFSSCEKRVIGYLCENCGTQRYTAITCGVRTCDNPICSNHKYRYVDKYTAILKHHVGILRFITLTYGEVKNISYSKINNVILSAEKLLKHFKQKGALLVCEIKKSNAFDFYLHIHIITAGNYIPQKDLSDYWKALTDKNIVDIRMIRNVKMAKNYIFKYIKKSNYLGGASAYADYIIQFHKKRLVRSIGVFYKIKSIYHKQDVICAVCSCVMQYSGTFDNKSNGWVLNDAWIEAADT